MPSRFLLDIGSLASAPTLDGKITKDVPAPYEAQLDVRGDGRPSCGPRAISVRLIHSALSATR